MLKAVISSIGWFKSGLMWFGVIVLLINAYQGSRVYDFYVNAPLTHLEDLRENYVVGDWVKVTNLRADFKNRVRGLKDKNVSENVRFLIPLRPFGYNQDDEINYLFLMSQNQSDIIGYLYGDYKEDGEDMVKVDELVAKYCSIDDLEGDVPLAVRKNRKVSEDVVILWYEKNEPAWAVFLIGGLVFLGVWSLMFLRHYLRWRKNQPKFFN